METEPIFIDIALCTPFPTDIEKALDYIVENGEEAALYAFLDDPRIGTNSEPLPPLSELIALFRDYGIDKINERLVEEQHKREQENKDFGVENE